MKKTQYRLIDSHTHIQFAAFSEDADIVIRPNLGSMKGNDFNGRNVAILAGEQATIAAMSNIRLKLKTRRER